MKRITKIEATEINKKKKLRVAAYARVSTDSDKQLASLKSQKTHYERYIKVSEEMMDYKLLMAWCSLVAQKVKNLPAMQETQV